MGAILHYHVETEEGYNKGFEHAQAGQPKQTRTTILLLGYDQKPKSARQAFRRGYNQGYRDVLRSRGLPEY